MLPEFESSCKRIGVVSYPATRRDFLQLLNIASAQHHVVRFKSGDHASHHVLDVAPPLFLAVFFQSSEPDVALVRSLFVRQMTEFHGLDDAIYNEGRTEPRAQAEEQHLAALVTSQSLHGGVVDDLDGTPERSSKIKTDPAPSQIIGFSNRSIVKDSPRIANRDRVIFPRSENPLHTGDHLLWRHLRTRWEFPRGSLPSREDLHVRSADIEHQHSHAKFFSPPQRVAHNCLRFIDDGIQVSLILEAFRVNLVDVFCAGRTRGKPTAAGHDFQTTDLRVVAGSASQLRRDRLPSQTRLFDRL